MVAEETSESTEELNMDVEYTGGQNEESPLLVAQRYLNIFHQIHIFNDRKKNEFDQSLLDMPVKIKEIVGELPGGRVLLEHIDELAEAKGMEKNNKKYAKRKGKSDSDDENKEDEEYEDAEENKKSFTNLSAEFAKELATSLAIALRETNMIRNPTSDGVMDALNKFRTMTDPNPQVQTIVPQQQITLQEVPTKNSSAQQYISPNNPQTVDIMGKDSDLRTTETVDIDISNILSSETLNNPKGYGNAMEQIRGAMQSDGQVSLDNLNNVKPVSLNLDDSSAQRGYSATQTQNTNYQATQNSDWEYVDENGNPISGDGWEYVDENGNPVG